MAAYKVDIPFVLLMNPCLTGSCNCWQPIQKNVEKAENVERENILVGLLKFSTGFLCDSEWSSCDSDPRETR